MTKGLENTRNLINKMLDSTTDLILANKMEDLYILIYWPHSQHFMESNGIQPCLDIDRALFVPIQVYLNKIKELGE